MKKNIYFLLVAIVALALVIALPFFFNNDYGQSFTAVYLSNKILFALLFVLSIGYCFFKNTANGISWSLIVINVAAQFVPFIIRCFYKYLDSRQLLFSVIIAAVALIAYIALSGGVITMNRKMILADKKYEGHEIEIVEDK